MIVTNLSGHSETEPGVGSAVKVPYLWYRVFLSVVHSSGLVLHFLRHIEGNTLQMKKKFYP